MLEFKKPEEALVEAIEGGKIVKVPESYAHQEGLMILRKHQAVPVKVSDAVTLRKRILEKQESFLGFDDFRKPLRQNELTRELADNFHWQIAQRRRARRLTRKQVADAISENENNLKLIENGVLPANNFILINKLENYLGLKLRKNRAADSESLIKKIAAAPKEAGKETGKEDAKKEEKGENLLGKDVEIYFEE